MLYINMGHSGSPSKCFPFEDSALSPLLSSLLLSFPLPRFSSRGTSTIQQVPNGLRRHKGTACRIRFLPCSHSTQFPPPPPLLLPPLGERWNGIHMFKRFRASVHISSRGRHEQTLRRSSEDKALNIIDRELVLGLKRSGTFSLLPPPHTDDCALARRVTQSRWHTQSARSPTVHRKSILMWRFWLVHWNAIPVIKSIFWFSLLCCY